MRLLNPTPEMIEARCHGINYFMMPNQTRDVNSETGNWLIDKFSQLGLVNISPTDSEPLQALVPKKIIEGLDSYINHLNDVLESYIAYDTELKSVNQYGTILKHKNVRMHTRNIEIASSMIKSVEEKYGISIRKAELEDKTGLLLNSIDSLIAEVESDVENERKSKAKDAELDEMLKEILPKNVMESNQFVTR